MAKISVVICCANAAQTLELTCASCKWADELIVVDSGSTDDTPVIAQRMATRYVVEPWRGYAGQKKFAAELCKNDWVFFVDGDEECSRELADELSQMSDADIERYDLLLIPRRNWVMGRVARAWWPDYLTRLFHRGRCTWSDEVLHDTRIPSDP
jgi:glycosyltransferase involved in cell wall biosynthesis